MDDDDLVHVGDDAPPTGSALEEQAVEQQLIPFMGDELAAALTSTGSIYITLPAMCSALGLDLKGQMQRIKRTRVLASGLRLIPLRTSGGTQRINCLRVDKVALWLAGVQTDRIKPQFRGKIEAYQEELAPVATQVFLRLAGISTVALVPTGDEKLTAMAEQLDSLLDVATYLREHMEALLETVRPVTGFAPQLDQAVRLLESLAGEHDAMGKRQEAMEGRLAQVDERTQRLTPARAREVQTFVERMVRQTKNLPAPLTFSLVYGRLKHKFRAGSYSEIPDERFGEVMAYLHEELRQALGGTAPAQGSLF